MQAVSIDLNFASLPLLVPVDKSNRHDFFLVRDGSSGE